MRPRRSRCGWKKDGATDPRNDTRQGPFAEFPAQSTPNVPGDDETGDHFGSAVHLADTHNDGQTDLIVGVAGENSQDGAVTYLRGDGRIGTYGTPGITPTGTGVATTGTPAFGVHLAG
ncbi:hypothetical protein [Streptomyces sp. NPDC050355]|uniref:hypothetical protein n=1 Tax=Streptomyces sp. NPDC050355 TaxID=3365609 RepID=UPI0037984BEE